MPTRDSTAFPAASGARVLLLTKRRFFIFQSLLAGLVALLFMGCSKDQGMEAIETDANGYFCQKCRAKIFTDRRVFLEKCPKCKEDALAEVVGYRCPNDQHLTLRPKVSGPEGAAVCEQCNSQLKNAMVQPHMEDLESWGATKVVP
jgi:predicted SprT family Zn-dependent metalloprotease